MVDLVKGVVFLYWLCCSEDRSTKRRIVSQAIPGVRAGTLSACLHLYAYLLRVALLKWQSGIETASCALCGAFQTDTQGTESGYVFGE